MNPVTVLIPVRNAESYLVEALESIIHQTFKDFDVILINDASTDSSLMLLQTYTDSYKNFKILNNDKCIGVANSLNRAIELVKTKYIARFDADDVCMTHRLQYQYDYMESNPDVDLVGSFTQSIDHYGNPLQINYVPTDRESIKASLIFYNPLSHPTVFGKTSVFKQKYSSNYSRIEDYELWARSVKNGFVITNIPLVLLNYRVHNTQISNSAHETLRGQTLLLCNDYQDYLVNSKLLSDFKTTRCLQDSTKSLAFFKDSFTPFVRSQQLDSNILPIVLYSIINRSYTYRLPVLLANLQLLFKIIFCMPYGLRFKTFNIIFKSLFKHIVYSIYFFRGKLC